MNVRSHPTDTLQELETICQKESLQDANPSDWLESVQHHLCRFQCEFQRAILPSHAQQYEQLRSQDNCLQPNITAMEQEDQRLTALVDELRSSLGEISTTTLSMERVVRIANQLRGLIVAVRSQRELLSHWYNASRLRNRDASS